ncbi:inactive tyrosine-protein kinase 7-like [Penaeus japonicus]|uniref:inactive tyrosine-protein kinase 7-like n=1 Tax=Penaeus japonicus TaxID=27405 RepID=UPI001C70F202|nr:inactive tyrosine-protein kinase 7-like [Penaeus japonicus]
MASAYPQLVCLVLAGVLRASGATSDVFYFSSWPRDERVGAGERRVMDCAVSDSTSITLSWHLDDRPITYSSRRHLRDGSREDASWDLVIERAVPEDAGEYTCIAHNTTSGFALTSLAGTLTVLWVAESSRVVLADHRELDSVKPGSSVTLRCRVDGGPDLYYSWKRNGDSVSGLDGVTVSRRRLTIDLFDPTVHNGVYTCSASIYKPGTPLHHDGARPARLTATTTSYPLVLAIKDPRLPSIVEIPESQVVGPDQAALLKCSYEDGTLTEWYLQDSGPLTNNSRHLLLGNGSLQILAASIGDEGVYKCVGVHPERIDSSSYAATLTLAYLDDKTPPTLEPGPNIRSSHVVGKGGRLRVICLPPAGQPHPEVTWVAPQLQKLQSSGHIQVEGAALVVEDATEDHAGNYTCIVSNLAGNASHSLELVVTRKPEVQMMTSSVSVLEEETGRLECRMDTSPPPYTNVSWTRDGHPVSVDDYRVSLSGMGEGVSQGVSVLRIRWARLEDAGLYVCVVTTEGHPPVHTMPAKFDVIERLKFSPRPLDSRVEVGGNVSIPCVARGEVPPDVNWYRPNGTKLVEAATQDNIQVTEGTLEVIGAELRDSGLYLCVASSEQGAINASINLAVIESPVMEWVTHSPVQVDKGGTLVLECRARGTPKPSIHWDYNHTPNAFDPERVEMHGNGTLQLSGVRREDSGVYGCTAGNMGGLVRAEITVSVSGESIQPLGRTVGVAVGGAAVYIALVGAMLIYCRQRRLRLKNSPPHTRGEGSEEAQSPEEQERLMYTARHSGTIDGDIREFGTATSKAGAQLDPTCQVQLSQVSTHTLGASTHLGLSQASTKTIGGSSVSTQHSSPLQPNSSPSAQSTAQPGPSDSMYPKHESSNSYAGQDKSKIQRENIQVLLTLGRGEFGEVQLARLRNSSEETDGEDTPPDPDKLVMVKVVSTRDEQLLAEVCREAAMFSGPPHPHVVSALGLCTSHTPHLLVTQYTDWGDLKQFLLATRKESPRPLGSLRPPPLTYQQCLSLALQVAEALEYLSGRRHIHKDIAARNCLITSKLQVKLAAPALTRDAYQAEYCTYRNQVLPVRWLAPEALLEDDYSMKSSVFSWAWLAWEILTQATLPYANITDQQVMAGAQSGDLQCTVPTGTPADLGSLLSSCWQHSPKARPSIQSVVETLKTLS